MAAPIKRDDVKQKWEDTEFPLVCETCLGDNPYVRMTVEPHGKKCQICEKPFTVFKWQAGTKGRLKRVEICRSCAAAKNVCQVCIYDLQYGLPVKVRDKVLRESGSAAAASTALSSVPQSHANRSWYTAQQQRVLDQGGNLVATPNALAAAKLQDMARMEPVYERNMPKLCSFFARGECDRGAACPFRHEMPRDRNDPMSKQSTKDRFYGTSDPVANKILGRKRKQEVQQQKQDEESGYGKAAATLYMRFTGDPPFPQLTEMAIRDQFYAYGEIVSVRVQADKGQAFVEYTQPEAAELAIVQQNRKELLGRTLYVAWARAPKRGDEAIDQQKQSSKQQASAAAIQPMAPPGADDSASNANKKSKAIPTNLIKIKPPPEVVAMAAARRAAHSGSIPAASTVPHPGGGPIKGAGRSVVQKMTGPAKPYYPSADPSRLGSKTMSSTEER